MKKHEFNLCKLEKAKEAQISFFASLKELKHEFNFFLHLKKLKKDEFKIL